MGNCPSCKAAITNVTAERVEVNVPMGQTWKGISYQCPLCRVILSVGIDPISLKVDTVAEVLKGLGKRRDL